jgi:hypothetical protein
MTQRSGRTSCPRWPTRPQNKAGSRGGHLDRNRSAGDPRPGNTGSDTAAALIDRDLTARLGSDRVFLDCRSIPAGADFAEELLGRLRACSVLVVVIGPRWLTLTNAAGKRRIDDPRDWIRREIAEALSGGLWVVPVLTGGAALPAETDLPADIAGSPSWSAQPRTAQSAADPSPQRFPLRGSRSPASHLGLTRRFRRDLSWRWPCRRSQEGWRVPAPSRRPHCRTGR